MNALAVSEGIKERKWRDSNQRESSGGLKSEGQNSGSGCFEEGQVWINNGRGFLEKFRWEFQEWSRSFGVVSGVFFNGFP